MNQRRPILSQIPPITLNLIIINFLIWLAELVLNRFHISLTQMLGMHYIEASDFRVWQIITYAFLHDDGSIWHLFFNMFSLFIFGSPIERAWGAKRFILFYFVCALSAAITQQIVWSFELHSIAISEAAVVRFPDGNEMLRLDHLNRFVTVGASGAVFGLLLAFGMLFPNAAIFLMFIPIPIKAKYFVIFYGLIELFMGIAPGADGVAHFAHVGGMIGALILILTWRKRGKISKKPFF